MTTTRPSSGRTTYHNDGTVTVWDCIRGQWIRTAEPTPELLSTCSHEEADRIVRHTTIAVSDDVILAWAIVAGENGDHLGSAIYQKAIGRDYSQVALDDDERRRVESLSIEECRALAEEHVRSSDG